MNTVSKKFRGRPRKSTDAREADRRRLVEAACTLLDEGGSPHLTARVVAERVGVSVGTVYGLFDHLEGLKLEANAVTLQELRAHLTEALAKYGDANSLPSHPGVGAEGAAPQDEDGRLLGESAPPATDAETALLALAHAYLDFARRHRRRWAALFDPVTIEAPKALAAEIAASFAIVEAILDRAGGEPDTIPVIAKALWSSVHGMVYLGETGSLGPVGPDDVPAMIDTLVRAAVKGLACGRG